MENGGRQIQRAHSRRDVASTGAILGKLDDHRNVQELLIKRAAVIEPAVLEELLTMIGNEDDEALVVEIQIAKEIEKCAELPVRILDLSLIESMKMGGVFCLPSKALGQENLGVVELGQERSWMLIRQSEVAPFGIVDGVRVGNMDVGEEWLFGMFPVEQVLPEKLARVFGAALVEKPDIQVIAIEPPVCSERIRERPL